MAREFNLGHWALGKRTWGQGERLVSRHWVRGLGDKGKDLFQALTSCPQVSPAPAQSLFKNIQMLLEPDINIILRLTHRIKVL